MNNEIQIITRGEFVSMLSKIDHATFITMVTETVPDMRKTNNPFVGKIYKRSEVNGVYFWDYERAVNRQLVREGKAPKFESAPRAWGKLMTGTGLVVHKGRFYVQIKVQNVLESGYYYDNDTQLTTEEVVKLKEFLPKRVEGARQGTESPVIIRDYAVDNIKEARMMGKVYKFSNRDLITDDESWFTRWYEANMD